MRTDSRIGGSTVLTTWLRTEGDRDAGANRQHEPIVALLPGVEHQVAEIALELAIEIEFARGIEQLMARVESGCPRTVIVDADVLGWPASFCLFARSLRPDVSIIAVLHHWSECEAPMREWVDAVLHKPPRLHEWALLFGGDVQGAGTAWRGDSSPTWHAG